MVILLHKNKKSFQFYAERFNTVSFISFIKLKKIILAGKAQVLNHFIKGSAGDIPAFGMDMNRNLAVVTVQIYSFPHKAAARLPPGQAHFPAHLYKNIETTGPHLLHSLAAV
jgi:hypothetical protein